MFALPVMRIKMQIGRAKPWFSGSLNPTTKYSTLWCSFLCCGYWSSSGCRRALLHCARCEPTIHCTSVSVATNGWFSRAKQFDRVRTGREKPAIHDSNWCDTRQRAYPALQRWQIISPLLEDEVLAVRAEAQVLWLNIGES